MIDFSSIDPNASFPERIRLIANLAEGISVAQLRDETNASVDRILAVIAGATDADVTFVPQDAKAFDEHAAKEKQHDGWTLAHVIAHQTASSEEAAFIAAELARGVENHGRSRYETAWESITTAAQLQQRLKECRRMRLAALDIWPDAPALTNTYVMAEGTPPINATARYALGLFHEHAHMEQLSSVMAQAVAARK